MDNFRLFKEFFDNEKNASFFDLLSWLERLVKEGGFDPQSPVVRFAAARLMQVTGFYTVKDMQMIEDTIKKGPLEDNNKNNSCCFLAKEVSGCVCRRKEVCTYHGDRHFGTHD